MRSSLSIRRLQEGNRFLFGELEKVWVWLWVPSLEGFPEFSDTHVTGTRGDHIKRLQTF